MKIVVYNEQKVFYKGKSLNAPFADEAVKEKSIDLFDDDDPCIIHKSYVFKTLAQQIEDALENSEGSEISLNAHPEIRKTLDIDAEGLKIRKEDG